jgi:NAD(P)-dependent dehydrogenase (short-subunit alcohol dehydrogenase family)
MRLNPRPSAARRYRRDAGQDVLLVELSSPGVPLAGLNDRIVIVTGGASGIGRAVAERLVGEGSRVSLVDRNEEAIRAACSELGDRVLGVAADVSSVEGTGHYFAATIERFGRVDGLHANAGIETDGISILDSDPASFDRIVAVNLRGVFLALRQMLRTLAAQKTVGSIVTTSSVLGLRGLAGSSAYCASKAAVISLTKTAAIEAGPAGHRVNAVLPGPTYTPMFERTREERQESYETSLRSAIPLGRLGQPNEVAALVAWLLSDESSYLTGSICSVDGGLAAS